MGQAKNRGSFDERRAAAIERDLARAAVLVGLQASAASARRARASERSARVEAAAAHARTARLASEPEAAP